MALELSLLKKMGTRIISWGRGVRRPVLGLKKLVIFTCRVS